MKTLDHKQIYRLHERGLRSRLKSVWSALKGRLQESVGSRSTLLLIEQAKLEWEVTADSLPQFVGLLDHTGLIRRANRTVERWGLGPVTGVKGLSLHALFHPGCAEPACYMAEFWDRAWQNLSQGQATNCEAADPILDRYLGIQVRPIAPQTARRRALTGTVGVVVVEDVTLRKTAEAALQKAHAELERRVVERTAALANAVTALKGEIAERTQAEVENARLLKQVQQSREQMRHLARQTVSAQEAERQRLSRELHDDAGQALTALKLRLDTIRRNLPAGADQLADQLAEAVELTGTTMDRLRTLARDLRPPALDTAGLDAALESLCQDFAGYAQLVVTYEGGPIADLPDSADICLYRFLQEALTNVAKHAQASRVTVRLERDYKQILLSVADDGRGFDQAVQLGPARTSQGVGLLGLRERFELMGGWLELKTGPGYGTRLTAHLPTEVY